LLTEKEYLFRKPFYAKDGKTRLPQYVAHRGFNKIYPENTRSAFTAAIDVGCHGIETDVQITKDGVVVISHVYLPSLRSRLFIFRKLTLGYMLQDATLNRCFGIDELINDCDWEYLSTLWTIREPRERMLRLSDLLDFLNAPSNAHVWVLLDIKVLRYT
jgi:phosphatidylglycerol phospholipase C